MTNEHVFQPLTDSKRFPLLASGYNEPCATLMACDTLVFFAPENHTLPSTLERKPGRDWHMYGDVRWSSPSAWVELRLHFGNFTTDCGILVMRADIPLGESDPLLWCAQNNPLGQILPSEQTDEVVKTRLQMLMTLAANPENIEGPEDERISSVQSYCIFHCRNAGEPQFTATYTDMLNVNGVPLPLYRMASVHSDDVPICRLALHLLFCMNEERLGKADFIEIPQLKEFRPKELQPGQTHPKWAQFHPSRVMRTRPLLRATNPPTELKQGIISKEDFECIADITRRETNSHLLAYSRDERPRDMALQQNAGNAGLTSFIHRANGGAIYVLPERLVEEFDNTDCSEVLLEDITLPFPNLFIKFSTLRPLLLTDNALVDGCYVVKQGDEYLFMLTSRINGVNYERSLSVTCIDPTFSIHLPASAAGLSINSAIEAGIEDFLAKNAPPEDDFSSTITQPNGTNTTVVDIRAKSRLRRIQMFKSQEPVFRACLNIVVNAACFIAFRPNDISDGWEGEPPEKLINAATDAATTRRNRDRKRDALKRLENGDFTKIRICGKDLFDKENGVGLPASGKSPRAHWRRGHWRRQRHGVGLTLMTLQWIRPTIVKKDSGPLVEARLYEIDQPEEK